MNVKPEYIRDLNLPELDEPLKTLPVEKRLFLVWAVNPTYASDQVTDTQVLGAGLQTVTVYTVPELYRLQVHSIHAESDSNNDEVLEIQLTVNGNNQTVFVQPTGGALTTNQMAIMCPSTLLRAGDSVQVVANAGVVPGNLTTNILGWLYEVAMDE